MTQLLQNALYGTALILAAALLRRALKERLIPEARLVLWAVCLFRLLTPAAPESALSLWGLFAQPEPVSPPPPQLYTPTPAILDAAPLPQPEPAGFPWELALGGAWLAVGLVLGLRYVLSWTRTRRAVAASIPISRPDPRYLPLPKCARLREGPMEGAPLTFGVAKPTVVLSPGLAGEELVCVLAHEGVHARRRDNLWHYVMALALAVHWWNPAVWLMSRLLRRDIELSCDRAALRALGPEKRAEYANALVTLATQADGPAFCQAFGRKAAEERIRSIMKFKKTSIIGAILSLALVLAVTVAFASEPRNPQTDTVDFHGQTFSRSALSQETLDWLDWYLALDEQEQLSISYIPSELLSGLQPDTQDAYNSEKAASDTVSVPYEVLAYAQDLSIGMTRDRVHELLGKPAFSMSSPNFSDTYSLKSLLPSASGEPQLGVFYNVDGTVAQVMYYADGTDTNGKGVSLAPWLASTGSASPLQEVDPDQVDLSKMKEQLAQKVADGKITQEEADARLAATEELLEKARRGEVTMLWTTGEDGCDLFYASSSMYYRDGDGKLVPMDPGNTVNGYTVRLPDWKDSGILGSYTIVSDGKTIRTPSGSYPLCDSAGCAVDGDHCHINGEVVLADYRDPYRDSVPIPSAAPAGKVGSQVYDYKFASPEDAAKAVTGGTTSCGVAGCTETRYHAHNEGRCILLSDPCPVEGCTIIGNHIHNETVYSCNGAGHSGGRCDGSCYTYNQPGTAACGVDGCTAAETHRHEGDLVIYAFNTQAAQSSGCVVDGCSQLTAHQHNGRWYNFMHEVCPVEGCTTLGDHTHNGVHYSCNGAGHEEGHCDGSCYTYNQPDTTTAVNTHHSESQHSGHH